MGSISAVSTVTAALKLPQQQQHLNNNNNYYSYSVNAVSLTRRNVKVTVNGDDEQTQTSLLPTPFITPLSVSTNLTAQLMLVPADPLFVDQYAGCFVSEDIEMDMEHHSHNHCLATKFIDDKLLSTIKDIDGPKQVVLFTDGMDTRPYRLGWPNSTLIFDISPEIIFRKAAHVLKDLGAKVPKGSLYIHVPWESSEIAAALRKKGFNGNRPSIWVIQGLALMSLESLEELLFIVSGLAMNGCLLLGEFPICLAERHTNSELDVEKLIDKLFVGNGFRVQLINYDEVAKNLGRKRVTNDFENVLFVAEQLRFSDDQMETWRKEFRRVEEEGDEEGFDEL